MCSDDGCQHIPTVLFPPTVGKYIRPRGANQSFFYARFQRFQFIRFRPTKEHKIPTVIYPSHFRNADGRDFHLHSQLLLMFVPEIVW